MSNSRNVSGPLLNLHTSKDLNCFIFSCPTQASTIEKVKCLEKQEQMLICEIIQDITGLVESHSSKFIALNVSLKLRKLFKENVSIPGPGLNKPLQS